MAGTRRRAPRQQQGSPEPLGGKESRREVGEFVERYDTYTNRGGLVPPPGQPNHVRNEDGEMADPRRRIYLGKQRLGKRWSEVVLAVEEGAFTWDEFVATLDATEVARGQLKDKTGHFRGRPPTLVPRGFYDACVKSLMQRGKDEWQAAYLKAVETMAVLADGATPGVKPADRIKAAQFVIERMEGKSPQVVEIKTSDPFADLLAGAVASVDEEQAIANAQDYMERMADQDG